MKSWRVSELARHYKVVMTKSLDDPNGNWNYEVVVKTNRKESGFEVDPNGRFVKHHEAN